MNKKIIEKYRKYDLDDPDDYKPMSEGEIKYTTFSSKDLSIRKVVNKTAKKIIEKKTILNLTFLPYI